MTDSNERIYKQEWTLKKVVCYLLYILVAKHLPIRLGPIGRASRKIRMFLSRPLFHKVEGSFKLGRGIDFDNGANIILRDHANIGSYASLTACSKATITIGRHVMMGKECIFICQNHKYQEGGGYDGLNAGNILVDDYAWLGHRVIVLSGVTIGKHSIIGAGAVISKDVPPYAIAVGNPAKVVKYRDNKPDGN